MFSTSGRWRLKSLSRKWNLSQPFLVNGARPFLEMLFENGIAENFKSFEKGSNRASF